MLSLFHYKKLTMYIVTMFDYINSRIYGRWKHIFFFIENATILFSFTFCHNTWKTDKLWIWLPSMGAVPSVKVIDHKVLVVSDLNDSSNVVYSFYVCVWNAIAALSGFFMWRWRLIISCCGYFIWRWCFIILDCGYFIQSWWFIIWRWWIIR